MAKKKFSFQGLEYEFDTNTKMVSGGKFAFPFHVAHTTPEMIKFLASNFPHVENSNSFANGQARARQEIANKMKGSVLAERVENVHNPYGPTTRGKEWQAGYDQGKSGADSPSPDMRLCSTEDGRIWREGFRAAKGMRE